MSMIKIAATALALAFGATVAVAQTATPAAPVAPKAPAATMPAPAAAPAAKAKAAGRKVATTPEGIACSQQADAKQLKGKPRKSFRAKCVKAMKAGAAKKS